MGGGIAIGQEGRAFRGMHRIVLMPVQGTLELKDNVERDEENQRDDADGTQDDINQAPGHGGRCLGCGALRARGFVEGQAGAQDDQLADQGGDPGDLVGHGGRGNGVDEGQDDDDPKAGRGTKVDLSAAQGQHALHHGVGLTYRCGLSAPPCGLTFLQGMQDHTENVAQVGGEDAGRQPAKEQLAAGGKVLELLLLPQGLANPAGGLGQRLPTGTGQDGFCRFFRRSCGDDAVGHKGGQKDDGEEPWQMEVRGLEEPRGRLGGRMERRRQGSIADRPTGHQGDHDRREVEELRCTVIDVVVRVQIYRCLLAPGNLGMAALSEARRDKHSHPRHEWWRTQENCHDARSDDGPSW